MSGFITPPPLNEGDKIGIVSPSAGLANEYPHVYERGIERLKSVFKLKPIEFPTAKRNNRYLQDHPEERATDIEQGFSDPDIQALIATIGGNDQIRILKHLDAKILRNNPTRFYGMSDNTNIAHYLWNQGIVSFYGGHLLTEFAFPGKLPEYLKSGLQTGLFDDSIGSIQPAPKFTDQDLDWSDTENLHRQPEWETNSGWVWRGSNDPVSGRTWGGSLEITHLQVAADQYLPDPETLDGAILLLETSEGLPSPADVQRMLLGIGERGLLSQFDGFLIGRIKARSLSIERAKKERLNYRKKLREVITDMITAYNSTSPIVFNMDFGHTNPIVPIPVGGIVSIDPHLEKISFR